MLSVHGARIIRCIVVCDLLDAYETVFKRVTKHYSSVTVGKRMKTEENLYLRIKKRKKMLSNKGKAEQHVCFNMHSVFLLCFVVGLSVSLRTPALVLQLGTSSVVSVGTCCWFSLFTSAYKRCVSGSGAT